MEGVEGWGVLWKQFELFSCSILYEVLIQGMFNALDYAQKSLLNIYRSDLVTSESDKERGLRSTRYRNQEIMMQLYASLSVVLLPDQNELVALVSNP